MGENKKAHKYPKQIFDAKKGNKSGSQTLAVEDKLSAVDETANATYLEILHPAAVYRVSILNKNDETKQTRVVKANIRPEHLTRMWMRIQMAEQKLFEMEINVSADFSMSSRLQKRRCLCFSSALIWSGKGTSFQPCIFRAPNLANA